MPPTPTSSQWDRDVLLTHLIASLAPHAETGEQRARLVKSAKAGLRAVGESRKEWFEHRVTLKGLAEKARINVHEDQADALEQLVSTLDHQSSILGHELGSLRDDEILITKASLPLHIHFLLTLANPADTRTHLFARTLLNPVPEEETEEQKLFREIMTEPFEGAHWKLNREREVGSEADWELSSSDSRGSTDDEEEDIRTPVSVRQSRVAVVETPMVVDDGARLRLADQLRSRCETAYWKTGGTVRALDDDEPITHGRESLSTHPSLACLLRKMDSPTEAVPLKTISMYELLREALMALSGRGGIVFDIQEHGHCSVRSDGPSVDQYSTVALTSHLSALAKVATYAEQLRCLVATTSKASLSDSVAASRAMKSSRTTKTLQAFAEACTGALQDFDTWLAAIEESTLPGVASASDKPVIVTLVSLQRDLERYHSHLLEALASLTAYTSSSHGLLNHMHGLALTLAATSPIAPTLSNIFIATASPIWSLLGKWLSEGMPIPAALSSSLESSLEVLTAAEAEREVPMDPELFIHRNHDVSWADEDFWSDGFVVGLDEWPVWLSEEARKGVLEAGKSMGLLKVLGVELALEAWPTLVDFVGGAEPAAKPAKVRGVLNHRPPALLFSPVAPYASDLISPHDLPSTLSAFLIPRIQLVQRTLRQALTDDCGMLEHLDALEDVLALRDGVVIHEWLTWLYERMQKQLPWTGFQSLNSAFRDAVAEQPFSRIMPSRCRLTYHGRQPARTSLRALSNLSMDCEVPFPLFLQFTPTSLRMRSEVFVLLLQVRLARHALLQMVFEEPLRSRQVSKDQHGLLRLRQKLLWFTQTMWTYLMEQAIEPKIDVYHDKIQSLTSMEDLIDAELEHTRSTRRACFLHLDERTTHETLLDILEMAYGLSDVTDASAVDTLVSVWIAGMEELARESQAEVARDWLALAFALGAWSK